MLSRDRKRSISVLSPFQIIKAFWPTNFGMRFDVFPAVFCKEIANFLTLLSSSITLTTPIFTSLYPNPVLKKNIYRYIRNVKSYYYVLGMSHIRLTSTKRFTNLNLNWRQKNHAILWCSDYWNLMNLNTYFYHSIITFCTQRDSRGPILEH